MNTMTKNIDVTPVEDHSAYVESIETGVLIGLVSERITQLVLDWCDGWCRAEMRIGFRDSSPRWIGRGPNAQTAIARAMMAFDASPPQGPTRTYRAPQKARGDRHV